MLINKLLYTVILYYLKNIIVNDPLDVYLYLNNCKLYLKKYLQLKHILPLYYFIKDQSYISRCADWDKGFDLIVSGRYFI